MKIDLDGSDDGLDDGLDDVLDDGSADDGSDDADSEDDEEVAQSHKRASEWCLGFGLLAIVVVIWTLSSVVVQHIFNDMNFKGPFFLTYIGSCLFTIYLPVYVVRSWCSSIYSSKTSHAAGDGDVEFTLLSDFDDENLDDDEFLSEIASPKEVSVKKAPSQYSVWETFKISLLVCPLWFAAQYTYNASLEYTRYGFLHMILYV